MNPKLSVLIAIILSVILITRLFIFFTSVKEYPDGVSLSFKTTLSSEPILTAKGQKTSIILPNYQRVIVTFPVKGELIRYGDTLSVRGKLSYLVLIDGKRIGALKNPEYEILKEGRGSLILKARERMVNIFNSSLGPEESGLMLGIVFGIKQELPKSFSQDLRTVGLTHVIAASGMNITMVGGFFVSFFGLFLKKRLAISLSILSILFYAVLAGLEPSIVRAAIMGIIVFSSQLFGRQSDTYIGLFIAAFLMLFVNPSLLFDVGFQLSFLATFGLVFFRPIFYLSKRLKKAIEKSIIGEDLATTLTAQVFTLPILLLNFGSYSILSILVNALVLWTVPILMVIGGISAIIGFFVPEIAVFTNYLSIPLLYFFEKVVLIFASFKLQISVTSIPLLLICGYYLLVFSSVIFLKQNEAKKKVSK